MLKRGRAWGLWLWQRLDGRELACAGVALAAAAALWWLPDLRLPSQLALGAIVLVALAVLARLLLPRLLGPVFFYDVVRTSRRSRFFLLRGSYAVVLLVTLFFFYVNYFNAFSLAELFRGASVQRDQISHFADAFFSVFISVQLLVVFLITPVFSAGAIAEEKERRTLEYLLTTDLSGREIVLGKLVSRLANLSLVMAAGLPVLGFVQFLGGVDPNLVLAGFAATGLMMLSLASLGLVNSVYCNRPREAIVLTYAEALGYLVLTGVCCFPFSFSGLPVLSWPGAGNVFVVMYRLREAATTGTLNAALPVVMRDFAIFHLLAAGACVAWAATRLRFESRQQASGPTRVVRVPVAKKGEYVFVRRPTFTGPPKFRPYLTGDPLLWKELHADAGFRLSQLAVALAISVGGILLYIAGAVFITGVLFSLAVGEWPSEFSNHWVRAVGTPMALLLLVAVAVRAAGAISSERERQTLDGLLTTPLENRHILWAKWWGSILSVRKAWWALGIVWVLGVLTGGLCPFALPLLAAGWFVYAAFAAGLGLYFSLVSRTTLRATIATLLTLVVVSVGHWGVGSCLTAIFLDYPSRTDWWLTEFHLYGLTPPWTLGFLAFYYGDFDDSDAPVRLVSALVGLACYAVAALLLWGWLNRRFAGVTGRHSAAAARRPPSVAKPSPAPVES